MKNVCEGYSGDLSETSESIFYPIVGNYLKPFFGPVFPESEFEAISKSGNSLEMALNREQKVEQIVLNTKIHIENSFRELEFKRSML